MNRRTLLAAALASLSAWLVKPAAVVKCNGVAYSRDKRNPRLWHCTVQFSDGSHINLSSNRTDVCHHDLFRGFVGHPKTDFAFSLSEWMAGKPNA